MPLGNWVILESDVPERMHFVDHVIQERDITDPSTGRPSTRNVLVLDVDEHNGRRANAKFSTISEKLYAQLEPYLEGNAYRGYDFVITKTGSGFRTSYSVQVVPRRG